MTVEEAIRARVAGLAAVVALAATRVYLGKLPQGPTYPCVRVSLVDDPEGYHLRGADGLPQARVQVDAYALEDSGVDVYANAAALATAIDGDGAGSGLAGFAGTIGGGLGAGLEIFGCFRVNRLQRYDPDELRVLTMTQDYLVSYRRQ